MGYKITTSELVETVREAGKPMTEPEIAEENDVSRPAVKRYRDELQEHPNLRHGQVGTALAYWWAQDVQEPGVSDTDQILVHLVSDKTIEYEDVEVAKSGWVTGFGKGSVKHYPPGEVKAITGAIRIAE